MSRKVKGRLTSCRKLIVPILLSYLAFQLCYAWKGEESNGVHTNSTRNGKNLFPFVWVTFQPSPCGTEGSTDLRLEGVCVQRGKCTKRGGSTFNGMCQNGFGECCRFTEMCNGTRNLINVDELVTVLESPSPINTECTFRFRKEPNICQIRLDFESFSSAQANEDGICEEDRLRITNTITVDRDFTTCGNLDGQHMYLTFGSQDSIEVTPILRSASARYRILATRIPCDSKNRAPDYCLQYFTKSSGTVRSFDYGGQQQSDQRYTVCVKPTSQSDEIMWRPCSVASTKPFDIITNPQPTPLSGDTCMTDWVQIKGGNKLCETFPNPAKSKWKPYDLLVNFDEREFPPPPPTFFVPIDPTTCASTCPSYSMPNMYDCGCLGTSPNQTCQCVVLRPDPDNPTMPVAPLPLVPPPDFDNIGFCLDYVQL